MNNLEDFIAQNRALFDQEELPQGGEVRFFSRLAQETASRSRKLWRVRLLSTAAAAVLVLAAGWGVKELAFNQTAVEARMLKQYRQQIEVLRQQVNDYVAVLSPADAEQIVYAVQLCTEELDICSEWLPREVAPAQRREVLKEYYAHHVVGMEQVVSLVMQHTNN